MTKRSSCRLLLGITTSFSPHDIHMFHVKQDAQKGRPARPQRVKTGSVPSGVR
jgi:hypothetical protein